MQTLTNAFALLGIALAVYAAGVRVLLKRNAIFTPSVAQLLGSLLVLAVLLVPSRGDVSITAFIRGFSSDLSITLFVVAVWSLLGKFGYVKPMHKREFKALILVIAAAALVLYPTALGWGDWDAYRLGWGSWWFLLVLLALCVVSAWMGLYVLPAVVALALLAWSIGLMESDNLWDYLLDPWLSAFALAYIVNKVFIKCGQFIFKRVANRSPH